MHLTVRKHSNPYLANAHSAHNQNRCNKEVIFETFLKLSQEPCFWCGLVGGTSYHKKDAKTSAWQAELEAHPFIYNGLDRIDNAKGYEPDNILTSWEELQQLRAYKERAELVKKIAKTEEDLKTMKENLAKMKETR